MAAPMRALGAHLRNKVCAAEVVPQFSKRPFNNAAGIWTSLNNTPIRRFSMFPKRSFTNRTGIWTVPNNTPTTRFNMFSKRSFSYKRIPSGIWITDSSGLKNISNFNMVQRKNMSFRLTASTKCNLGSYRPIMTNGKNQGNSLRMVVRPLSTNEKLSLNIVHTGSTPRYMKGKALVEKFVLRLWNKFWKSLEDDFVKELGQYVATGIALVFAWFAYNLMLALGLDTEILDKLRGHKRIQSEENKMALKILADILERKDMRLKLLEEENEKMRQESQRARQAHEKEVGDLKEEVRVLNAAIRALEEHERGNKIKEGSET